MGDYLIVQPCSAKPDVLSLSEEIRRLARLAGFDDSHLSAEAWIATKGPQRPTIRDVGGWRLVGDVMDRRRPTFAPDRPDDPWTYERKMLARLWGRFIGVRMGGDGRIDALLRDPSGALDCIAWRHDDLLLIASSAPPWLLDRLPPNWRIAPERLAEALHNPLLAAGSLLLDGPVAVAPGAVQPMPLERPAVALWSALTFAGASLDENLDAEQAVSRLKAAIEEGVQGLAGLSAPLAAEISGGLDSSVVAATLVEAGIDVRLWLNAYGATIESDERRWVAPLAEHLNIAPLSAPHTTAAFTSRLLERANQDFRPGLAALDTAHDLDWAERLNTAGVTALMTGKGGDSVLMQGAGADVFTDLWLRRGWRAVLSSEARAIAVASERSLWSLTADARRFRREGGRPPLRDDSLLTPTSETAVAKHWRLDSAAFGPAKAWQIAGVLDNVSRHGRSRLTETIDVRHPFCTQPVVEACLAIPAHLLALGGRDRGLARYAFRNSLPRETLERRSKGDMSRVYGKILLDYLPFLRPWLMEGRLADLGVIDIGAADRLLRRESLIWRGHYAPIMMAAAFEAWVRVWERRLAPESRSTTAASRPANLQSAGTHP